MMVTKHASEMSESNSMEMLLYVSLAVERIAQFELLIQEIFSQRCDIKIRYSGLRIYDEADRSGCNAYRSCHKAVCSHRFRGYACRRSRHVDVDKEQIISIHGIKVLNVVDWLLE